MEISQLTSELVGKTFKYAEGCKPKQFKIVEAIKASGNSDQVIISDLKVWKRLSIVDAENLLKGKTIQNLQKRIKYELV